VKSFGCHSLLFPFPSRKSKSNFLWQIEVNYVSNKIMRFYSLNNVIDYKVANNISFFHPFQDADKNCMS